MRTTTAAIVTTLLCASTGALALGPIENGTYVGSSSCYGEALERFSLPGEIIVTDDTMLARSGEMEHLKTFVFDEHGGFTINPDDEHGTGYVTAYGIHFEIEIFGMPGEDTFFFHENKLYLISSAKMGKGRVICEGVYEKVEAPESKE